MANHLRASQSAYTKSTIHLCTNLGYFPVLAGNIRSRDVFRPIVRERKYLMDNKCLLLTSSSRSYRKLRTEFFPLRFMAQARSARAINRRGKTRIRKGRFTRYDFDSCDKLTTGLRHDLGPYTRVRHFHLQN